MADAGVIGDTDLAVVRSLMSGIAGEQIANDPKERTFAGETEQGIRYLLSAFTAEPARRPER